MSTKYGQLIGLRAHHQQRFHTNASELLFQAQLPYSLTRLRQCDVRPRWKAAPPSGVLVDNIIGCASDGTLIGVAILDKQLWRRLSWLQRLCDWSEELSPHSYQDPVYTVGEGTHARDERALPIGLSEASTSDIMMGTSKPKLGDRHIDGDVLGRVLQKGGSETLKRLVREVAEKNDRVAEWMNEHLDEELEAVDQIIEMLRRVLDCWF